MNHLFVAIQIKDLLLSAVSTTFRLRSNAAISTKLLLLLNGVVLFNNGKYLYKLYYIRENPFLPTQRNYEHLNTSQILIISNYNENVLLITSNEVHNLIVISCLLILK